MFDEKISNKNAIYLILIYRKRSTLFFWFRETVIMKLLFEKDLK